MEVVENTLGITEGCKFEVFVVIESDCDGKCLECHQVGKERLINTRYVGAVTKKHSDSCYCSEAAYI